MSYSRYLFNYYKLEALLNRLMDLGVEVKKYYVYNGKYYLKIKSCYDKVIKDNFNDYVLLDRIGFINVFKRVILNPFKVIGLVSATIIFFFLNNIIFDIKINGDYPSIDSKICEYLNENGISKYSFINLIDNKKISMKLSEKFSDDLEFIEVNRVGNNLYIDYKKRRKKNEIIDKYHKLIASKDGVIRKFEVSKGVKKVKEYEYVKKGDILVDDIVLNHNNEIINVDSYGRVFANTFYYIEINVDLDLDSVSKYAYMLDLARNKVGKNIDKKDEYIEKENILVSDINKGYLKVFYILYEDIT